MKVSCRHVQAICDYLAYTLKLTQGLDVDPVKNIAMCCGQSEAFATPILASVFLSLDIKYCPQQSPNTLQNCLSLLFMHIFLTHCNDLVRTVVDEGDEILLLDPAYETYEACITMVGGTLVRPHLSV